MRHIIGPNDKRTKVTFTLPFNADGEPAFDENDKQISEPVEFSVPRYDFIPRSQLRQLMQAMEDLDKEAREENRSAWEVSGDSVIEQLRPFVDDTVLKLLADVPSGILTQIQADWAEASSIPLGKSRESTASSKSSKARSTTTSSDTDSD